MTETILLNFASKIVGKIGLLALQEVRLGWGLEEELKTLEDTVSTIKEVLLDAEKKQELKINMRNAWYCRLQSAFYEAVNMLDEFQYETLKRQVLMSDRSIGVKVHKFFSFSSNPLVFGYKMGCKIKMIRRKLDRIADDRTKFHPIRTRDRLTHSSSASRSVSTTLTDSEFVGRKNDKAMILQLLMIPSHDGENVSVIPVAGIGGLGKTTLVRWLYNYEMVVKHFELRIWVSVAQDFNVKHVVRKIIKSITDSAPCADFNSNQLQAILQENLNSKRFLLVLDDVCNCDYRDWVKFFKFLADGANGSKIVVTTRNKLVASTMSVVPMYNLGRLSDEDCHELLLKWAGLKKDGKHANLPEIAKEIVKNCHGYPLAAKTVGSLLFMKTDENEWLYLKDKELCELVQNNKRDILPMLRFKYNPLPADLKRCFTYCSIFPKNYEIEIDKLIQLWMAQGLIELSELSQELEDIGDGYFNQLCSIFFLEKSEEQHGNLINTCRMPEIIHDLAVFMANKECLSTANYCPGPISERVKHVSFRDYDCSREGVTKSLFKLKDIRTVFFPFQGVGAGDKGFVNRCISEFKYQRVLDLSNSSFRKLPHSIGNLKHLRFLDLSGNANIETLPDAICKLYNLQTLRICYCVKIRELPKNIGNLINLRHLYLTTQQCCLPGRQIRRLTSLRSFRITGCGNLTSLPEEIQHLTELTTVTIAVCPNLTSLPSTMKNLTNLRNLEISNCPNLDLAGWDDFRGLRRLQ